MPVRAKRQVFASDKPKVTLAKEKKRVDRKTEEKERKREEARVALLVFKLATLKKLLDGSKMYMYVHVVRDKFGDGKKNPHFTERNTLPLTNAFWVHFLELCLELTYRSSFVLFYSCPTFVMSFCFRQEILPW